MNVLFACLALLGFVVAAAVWLNRIDDEPATKVAPCLNCKAHVVIGRDERLVRYCGPMRNGAHLAHTECQFCGALYDVEVE